MKLTRQEIILPFSNPIFVYNVPYQENFRMQLIEECIKYRNETESINLGFSNRQVGWQSQKVLFTTNDPCLKKIAENIGIALGDAIKTITPSIDFSKYKLKTCEGWININQKGTLHFPHIHTGSTFSGVFYVKVPKSKKIDINGTDKPGFIEFLDPRNDVTSFANRVNELSNSLTFNSNLRIEPEEGTLLMFPAWLKHWVYPNNESTERISISFNIVIGK